MKLVKLTGRQGDVIFAEVEPNSVDLEGAVKITSPEVVLAESVVSSQRHTLVGADVDAMQLPNGDVYVVPLKDTIALHPEHNGVTPDNPSGKDIKLLAGHTYLIYGQVQMTSEGARAVTD